MDTVSHMFSSLHGAKLGYLRVDPVMLGAYVFYSGILIFKLMLLGPLTCYLRLKKRVMISPEDSCWGGTAKGLGDPDIERVRRAHQNDLENLVPFLITGALYILVESGRHDRECVLWHFRLFTLFRLAHTAAYLLAIRQPARAIFWLLGWLITASMLLQIILVAAHEPLA